MPGHRSRGVGFKRQVVAGHNGGETARRPSRDLVGNATPGVQKEVLAPA